MIIKNLCWNVRGLCDDRKKFRVRELISTWKPNILCLQETKWPTCADSDVFFLWGNRNVEWLSKDSDGASGGLLIAWDKELFQICGSWIGTFSAMVILQSISDGFQWCLFNSYGPCDRNLKLDFLSELRDFLAWWHLPACLMGDFNLVRSQLETSGGERPIADMDMFNDFIADSELIDLPLCGGTFTHSNLRGLPTLARLDRVLISHVWEEHFPDCRLSVLPRVCSDHSPLLLSAGVADVVIRPWRFELMWHEHEDYHRFLEEVWNKDAGGFGGIFCLARRLKLVKESLKVWNRNVFKCVDSEIARILGLVADLDRVEEGNDWSEEGRLQRCAYKVELDTLWKRQEISWRQKSRDTWTRLGDRNTAYFHRVASHNRRRNFLGTINVEAVSFSGQTEVAAAIVSFYTSLYHDDSPSRPFPTIPFSRQLGPDASTPLISPFSEEEVFRAVKCCAGDKAPGPDGLPMNFYKHSWTIVKSQVLCAFSDFFERSSLPVSVNSTFICLIPKKDVVEDVRDFRPISLTGSIYKLISKVLMERLKPLLPALVSPHQCAFVSGRQIMDASLVANELIDSRRRSGRSGLVVKLDIEKAFDHVNWNCLLQILGKMGFPSKWIGWIRVCISTPRFSVVVNGQASGFFPSSRGLRQGDSLSPFLFILVMNILSDILQFLHESNSISGFFMDHDAGHGEVTHLLYADDSILFCDASIHQVRSIMAALIVFQTITGLKVNLHKSSIAVVGQVDDPQGFADALGCRLESFPSTYLGLPLGARAANVALWNPMIARVRDRLDTWRARHLSFGGRLTLIKSVLTNLPVYFLSMFRAPAAVIKDFEKIQRNFLWSGHAETRKFHLVSWDRVKTPISRGGLGILDISCLNKALLSKWLWRFGTEQAAWWRDLIRHKYGLDHESEWRSVGTLDGIGWSVWYWIWKESNSFWDIAFVDPGGGERVRFWHDTWLPGKHLVSVFPRVAAATLNTNCFVSDLLLNDSDASFPTKTIWNALVPTKISCFTWLAFLDSIATIDNLRRRGLIVPNRCVLCCQSEESVSHLLLHCPFTAKVWSWFKVAFGICGPWPCSVQQLLLEWRAGLPASSHNKYKPVIPHAVMWFVWLERNNRIFRDSSCTDRNLAWKIAFNTSRWLMVNKAITPDECSAWLNSIFHPP
ncbi:LINE-1 retrotransposable element ORF2 protein [Linum grandiflorum]